MICYIHLYDRRDTALHFLVCSLVQKILIGVCGHCLSCGIMWGEHNFHVLGNWSNICWSLSVNLWTAEVMWHSVWCEDDLQCSVRRIWKEIMEICFNILCRDWGKSTYIWFKVTNFLSESGSWCDLQIIRCNASKPYVPSFCFLHWKFCYEQISVCFVRTQVGIKKPSTLR
jgi:hypothetical protein